MTTTKLFFQHAGILPPQAPPPPPPPHSGRTQSYLSALTRLCSSRPGCSLREQDDPRPGPSETPRLLVRQERLRCSRRVVSPHSLFEPSLVSPHISSRSGPRQPPPPPPLPPPPPPPPPPGVTLRPRRRGCRGPSSRGVLSKRRLVLKSSSSSSSSRPPPFATAASPPPSAVVFGDAVNPFRPLRTVVLFERVRWK